MGLLYKRIVSTSIAKPMKKAGKLVQLPPFSRYPKCHLVLGEFVLCRQGLFRLILGYLIPDCKILFLCLRPSCSVPAIISPRYRRYYFKYPATRGRNRINSGM